jgi:phenylalanyl-tRNA synthetase beta chain
MKILKSWLQDHIEETLPSDEKIAEILTLKSSEVEGVESVEVNGKKDTVFDIKVLPDRAHYMLSHRGVAYDLGAILDLKSKILNLKSDKNQISNIKNQKLSILDNKRLSVKVESPLCNRYFALRIDGINNSLSPKIVTEKLQAIGARSINAIVDATNIAMFDTGQPLHAFDAEKVIGGITVRLAKNGESIETLTGEKVELKSHHLVIADEVGPLAIAGVKGGKRAEVTLETKNILLEGANFDPVAVRKTSFEVGIRNDSSKRFENEITPHLIDVGISKFLEVLENMNLGGKSGYNIVEKSDVYKALPERWSIRVSHKQIETVLNYSISEKEVTEILNRLMCDVSVSNSIYEVRPPYERLDLVIAEDVIDEIGRIGGLDRVVSILPEVKTNHKFSSEFLLSEKLKSFFFDKGFSEVQTRSFSKKGDVEVAYPMAKDKGFLRTSLVDGVSESVSKAVLNAPILGLEVIKIFEIGSVFSNSGESLEFCASIQYVKKIKNKDQVIKTELESIVSNLEKIFGKLEYSISVNTLCIKNLEKIDSKLTLKDINTNNATRNQFVQYSNEPFIVRDIAIFVPEEVNTDNVREVVCVSAIASAGGLLVKGPYLFDEFSKDGKKSVAFRMIFQAIDRTLSDDEVNGYMQKVYGAVKEKGWEVR